LKDRQAEKGKPGEHRGRRVRWRDVWRRTREANRPAVKALLDKEIELKEKYVRTARIAAIVRNILLVLLIGGIVVVRCAL